MRGPTHAAIGAAVGAVMAAAAHAGVAPIAALAAVGGLLPDIDHPYSTLGRYVPWPAVTRQVGAMVLHGRRWFGGHVVWHRGETHSVGAAGIAMAAAGSGTAAMARWGRAVLAHAGLHPHPWSWGAWAAMAVGVGYLSHLAADTLNRSPQMLWWPFSRRLAHPPWRGVREASAAGRAMEYLVVAGAVAAVVAVAR
jgi:inner membrane protein